MSKNRTKRAARALGQALLFYRGGMSRAALSTATGIQRGSLIDYEKGKTIPEPETLQRIADALEVAVPKILAFAALLEAFPEIMDREATPVAAAVLERCARFSRSLRATAAPVVPAGLAGYTIGPPGPSTAAESDPAPQRAEALWERLRRYTAAQRWVVAQEVPLYQDWSLSVRLCDESLEAAATKPAVALELARLAERIAEIAPGSEAWRLRLRGFCAFHVGSAQRANGKLHAAREATERADQAWAGGAASDPAGLLDPARCLGLKASLLRDLGEPDAARQLLRQALALGSIAELPYLLLCQATILTLLGDHTGAITTLQEVEGHIKDDRTRRLLWHQRFNLAVNLRHLERYKDAEELLPEIRRLSPQGVSGLRIKWLEGAVAAGLGRAEEAETLLVEVKKEFLELRNAFDAALVSLDLAALYLRQNRTAEVKKLATGMVKTFLELKVHKEALRAARLFQEAAVRERATVELVGRLAAYLRRAQLEVALRFGG